MTALSGCCKPHLYKVIAHRGGYLENGLAECSIASLKETIRERCYGSECDVMWTVDGQILVCHPDDSGKVNGLVPSKSTLADIRAAGKLSASGRSVSVQERIPAAGNYGECIRLEEAETC